MAIAAEYNFKLTERSDPTTARGLCLVAALTSKCRVSTWYSAIIH